MDQPKIDTVDMVRMQLFTKLVDTYSCNVEEGRETFHCEGCDDRFALKKSLTSHLERSSILIKHTCHHCNKELQFKNRCKLFIHLKGHGVDRIDLKDVNIQPLPFIHSMIRSLSRINASSVVNLDETRQKEHARVAFDQFTKETKDEFNSSSIIVIPESPKANLDVPNTQLNNIYSNTYKNSNISDTVEKVTKSTDGIKKVRCVVCNVYFVGADLKSTMWARFIHYQRNDSNGVLVECSECSLVFSNSCAYSAHKLFHENKKPYICERCGTFFSSIGMHKMHSKYKCPYAVTSANDNGVPSKQSNEQITKVHSSETNGTLYNGDHSPERLHCNKILNKTNTLNHIKRNTQFNSVRNIFSTISLPNGQLIDAIDRNQSTVIDSKINESSRNDKRPKRIHRQVTKYSSKPFPESKRKKTSKMLVLMNDIADSENGAAVDVARETKRKKINFENKKMKNTHRDTIQRRSELVSFLAISKSNKKKKSKKKTLVRERAELKNNSKDVKDDVDKSTESNETYDETDLLKLIDLVTPKNTNESKTKLKNRSSVDKKTSPTNETTETVSKKVDTKTQTENNKIHTPKHPLHKKSSHSHKSKNSDPTLSMKISKLSTIKLKKQSSTNDNAEDYRLEVVDKVNNLPNSKTSLKRNTTTDKISSQSVVVTDDHDYSTATEIKELKVKLKKQLSTDGKKDSKDESMYIIDNTAKESTSGNKALIECDTVPKISIKITPPMRIINKSPETSENIVRPLSTKSDSGSNKISKSKYVLSNKDRVHIVKTTPVGYGSVENMITPVDVLKRRKSDGVTSITEVTNIENVKKITIKNYPSPFNGIKPAKNDKKKLSLTLPIGKKKIRANKKDHVTVSNADISPPVDLNLKKYECAICAHGTNDRDVFRTHIAEHRKAANLHQCLECGYCYVADSMLLNHLSIVHGVSDTGSYIVENRDHYLGVQVRNRAED